VRKRSTLAALVLALTLTGAVAFAQSAGQGADLGARLAELQARARRLELLAGVPAEARAQAEELIDRQEELKLAEQELEVERLEALVEARRLKQDEARDWIDAFQFLQGLRLRVQQAVDLRGSANPNMVELRRLTRLDRRILREALRQARLLQQRLRLDYPG